MSSINNSNCANSSGHETLSRVLSSMGCSWNTNEMNNSDDNSMSSSISLESVTACKVSHPSFSLIKNGHDEHDDEEGNDYDSDSSSYRREAVQSKASLLMSRKGVYCRYKDGDDKQQSLPPQRIMLENILDSFDQLVEARIRAYARILSNHVRVLSESNNTRGALIAEYKLQTLLKVAANHLLFDSISTEFKTGAVCTEDVVFDDVISATNNSTAKKEEKHLSLPIDLIVEIRSPRFFHEGLETMHRNDDESPSHRRHQGKLTFRAKGKIRGDRIVIGGNSNDTNRCLTPGVEVRRNSNDSEDSNRMRRHFLFHNIDIDIDCDAILSQMMEEASKVVTMAVDLTNLAWTNNTEKQEEINNMNMNDMIADKTRNTANIIVDDDDSSSAGEHLLQPMTGKRSRSEDNSDNHTSTGIMISKQVSEHSFCPLVQVVCDEEHIEEPRVSDAASSSAATTITNLHVLDQDEEHKTRYFVSDPSYESSSSGSGQKSQPEDQDDEDEYYNKISAERACNIVDFALAGGIIPCDFSSNKKLRTK